MNDQFIDRLAYAYFFIKEYVIEEGYSFEIDYASDLNFNNLTESLFLEETAWVILSSGMSFKIISDKFHLVSEAFYNWESANKIYENAHDCKNNSLKIFNNQQKIDAIITVSSIVKSEGFRNIKTRIGKNGVDYLTRFPFIGPVTKFHLAKNIGINVTKPDRHLVRISSAIGYDSPNDLCNDIAKRISEKKAIIDLVFWRYATLENNYLSRISHLVNSGSSSIKVPN
jgi:hypothetical protein